MPIRIVASITIALTLALPAPSSYSQNLLKFGHAFPADSPWGKGALQFADTVKQKSNGRISVDVFPAGAIGKESELLQMAQSGAIEFALVPVASLVPRNRNFRVFDALFLFEDLGPVVRFQQSEAGRALLQQANPDVRGLSYWHWSMRWMAGKKPFESPAALKGLKIAELSGVIASQVVSLGATPVQLPAAELGPALQMGSIDAIDVTPFRIRDQKLGDVVKVLTLTNHAYVGYVLVVSDKAWHALSRELQVVVERAGAEAAVTSNQLMVESASESLQALRRAGIKIEPLTEAQRSQWIQASRKQWADVAPSRYIDLALTFATGGGGDYCVIPECRCSDRSCKQACCK